VIQLLKKLRETVLINFSVMRILMIFFKLRANGTVVFKPGLNDFKPIKSTYSSFNPGLRLLYSSSLYS